MCKLVSCFRQAYGKADADNDLIIEGNYRGMEAHLANRIAHPEIPFLDLRFEDIVGAPDEVIERVYAHAGMELSEGSRRTMLRWNAENVMHKLGEFKYSLADAGLDPAVIRVRMAGYFELLDRLAKDAELSAQARAKAMQA